MRIPKSQFRFMYPTGSRGYVFTIARSRGQVEVCNCKQNHSADPGNDVERHGSEDDQGLAAFHLVPDERFSLVVVFLTIFYLTDVILRASGWWGEREAWRSHSPSIR